MQISYYKKLLILNLIKIFKRNGMRGKMRFGILSDTHLGKSRFRKISNMQNTFCDLGNKVFEEAMGILGDPSHDIDAVLIVGDLYDSPNPSVQSIKVANSLVKLDVPKYILGGNHDFSQKDATIGCHPFDLLKGSKIITVYEQGKFFDFDDCDLTMIPYKSLNEDSFKSLYRGKLRDKSKCSILLIHGSIDLNGDSESLDYTLPKSVAANYNLVIAGHVHLAQLIKTKTTSILVPGSIMPSAQANSNALKPSVYIYDTDSKKIESIELKLSPKIYDVITDDINVALEKIANQNFSNDLYFVKYNGKMQDIDEYLYKRASQNILNLSIQTNEQIEINTPVKKMSDFWTYVDESCPIYYDEFKSLLKGE